jgi:hypothetical protein
LSGEWIRSPGFEVLYTQGKPNKGKESFKKGMQTGLAVSNRDGSAVLRNRVSASVLGRNKFLQEHSRQTPLCYCYACPSVACASQRHRKIQNKLYLSGWKKKIKLSMLCFSSQLYTWTGEPEHWYSEVPNLKSEHMDIT